MPEFQLNEADSDFRQRSSDVFACLEGLESDHEGFLKRSVAEREDVKKTWRKEQPAAEELERPEAGCSALVKKRVEEEKGTFAVPRVPPRRPNAGRGRRAVRGGARGPPDHVKNPQRWTAYSLAETEEVTDSHNARVAFDFLSDLRKRREAEAKAETEAEREEGEDEGKIIFRPKRAKMPKAKSASEGNKEARASEQEEGSRPRCSAMAPLDEEEEKEEEEGKEAEQGDLASKESPASSRAVVFRKSAPGARRRGIRARVADEEDTG